MNKNHSLHCLFLVAATFLAFGLYWWILSSTTLDFIGLDYRSNFWNIIICSALVLYLAYLPKNSLGAIASLSATLVLFSMPLLRLWSTGVSVESFIIGGFLPFSDALRHLPGAIGLLAGEKLTGGAAATPLFPSFIASILAITQGNFQTTLGIITGIAALATTLLVRDIRRHMGVAVAVITLLIVFLFYRRFIGSYLTENLGLILGLLAFSMLWRGATQKNSTFCYFGLTLMMIALYARPGAVMVLPAIIVWIGWTFRRRIRMVSHIGTISLLLALIALLLITSMSKTLTEGTKNDYDGGFINAAYGIVVGVSNRQFSKDYPDATPSDYLQILSQSFSENPTRLISKIPETYKDFFHIDRGAFGFGFVVNDDSNDLFRKTRYLLFFSALMGFALCLIRLRDPLYSLIAALNIGILLSVPIFQVTSSDNLRIFATTMPITAVLASIPYGVFKNLGFYTNSDFPRDNIPTVKKDPLPLIMLSFLVLLGSTLFPMVLQRLAPENSYDSFRCNDGTDPFLIHFREHSSLELIEDSASVRTRIPSVRLSDFRNGLTQSRDLLGDEIYSELMILSPGITVLIDKDGWVIIDHKILISKSGNFLACEKPRRLFFRYVESLHSMH